MFGFLHKYVIGRRRSFERMLLIIRRVIPCRYNRAGLNIQENFTHRSGLCYNVPAETSQVGNPRSRLESQVTFS